MRTRDVRYEFQDLRGEEKLRELILYISEKCANDPHFGAVKLNKILHYSDEISFAVYGTPITGIEYAALERGPGPKRLLPVKKQMIERGQIVEEERQVGPGLTQRRIVPLVQPDLLKLSGRDIAVVDSVIQELWKLNASEVSKLSHGRAWRLARKHGTLIPYESIFLSSEETATDSDIIRGKQLAEKFGWNL